MSVQSIRGLILRFVKLKTESVFGREAHVFDTESSVVIVVFCFCRQTVSCMGQRTNTQIIFVMPASPRVGSGA